jgi:hypothetical protein
MKSKFLQVCAYDLEISATSRAGDVVAALTKALEIIGPVASDALRVARG